MSASTPGDAVGSRFAFWPWLQQPLQHALAQLHSHAVLLHGPQGVGQYALACALARAWLCEAQKPGATLQPACGHCASCRLMEAGSHPDAMLVVPEALAVSHGWGQTEAEADGDGKEGKARKPSQEIKVEAVRQVVQFAQQTSSRGRAKVVIVHPAERMNTVAANTLLKTLEEPPGQVRFVLSGGSIDGLLPTVRSRCQAWAMQAPALNVGAEWLMAQGSVQGLAEAQVLLMASGGQPLTALERLAQGLTPEAWRSLPRAVVAGQPHALQTWTLPMAVEALQKLCHDLCCTAAGAAPRFFPPDCLPEPPALSRLLQWSQELNRLARHADHPWNLPLKLEALLLQSRAVLRVRAPRANPRPVRP